MLKLAAAPRDLHAVPQARHSTGASQVLAVVLPPDCAALHSNADVELTTVRVMHPSRVAG